MIYALKRMIYRLRDMICASHIEEIISHFQCEIIRLKTNLLYLLQMKQMAIIGSLREGAVTAGD